MPDVKALWCLELRVSSLGPGELNPLSSQTLGFLLLDVSATVDGSDILFRRGT